jgi:outer membrane receptor protein involved in Fe transport
MLKNNGREPFPIWGKLRCRLRLGQAAWVFLLGLDISMAEVEGDGAVIELESFQVTATRRPALALEVSEAITLVDPAEIARRSPDVLAEMLRGKAGTWFQQTTPGQGIPIIRGLKGSEVLHLVDGMRLNNAFFRNAPNQYLGLVDAFAVSQMEVIRGSAPALHGADAMGGVVQVLSPEPDFYTAEWQQEGRLYGSYNSADSSWVGRAEAAAGKSGTALSGGVTWQDHGNRSTGGGETIIPSAYEVKAADLKWRRQLGENGELMLSGQVLEQPSTPRVDELVPGFGQPEPSSSLYEFKPNRRSFLHARYRLDSQASWFEKMELHAARQVITDDRLSQEFGSDEQVSESNESTLDGLTIQFNSPWNSGSSTSSELVWGLEYYTDEVRSSRLRTDTDSGESGASRGRFPDQSTMDSLAVYAANRWQWEKLSFEAGLRYSRFDIFLPGDDSVPSASLDPDDLTGDVHASYELSPGVKLVSNVGRGFRPPNIFDLGTLGPRPGNRFNQPNPNLEPETVWSYDLGIKTASSRFEAELFVFYSDYKDKITSVFTGEITPQGRQVVSSANLNSAKLYGVESGLRWRFAPAYTAYAVVNYTRGEEQDFELGTVPADRIPPLNSRVGMTWLPGNGWRLEPWLDFASKQDRLSPRDEDDPRIDPDGTEGYVTVNMLTSWQLKTGLEIGLRLENLLDEAYREHGSGIDASGRNIGFWIDMEF